MTGSTSTEISVSVSILSHGTAVLSFTALYIRKLPVYRNTPNTHKLSGAFSTPTLKFCAVQNTCTLLQTSGTMTVANKTWTLIFLHIFWHTHARLSCSVRALVAMKSHIPTALTYYILLCLKTSSHFTWFHLTTQVTNNSIESYSCKHNATWTVRIFSA